ncbi:uncharacterized protein LOC142235412 [Haematobia irritans]|uniref:uncharacterized protein LOC142235412 n=1 Tax=Haematobia irritans TaxID=7368 RepID=UPI003F4FB1BE
MPEKERQRLTFKNFKRQIKVSHTVYADFECVLEDCSAQSGSTSKTTYLKEHVPCAYGYKIICSYDSSQNILRTYTGADASKEFLKNLIADCKLIYKRLKVIKPMDSLTPLETREFLKAKTCHICKGVINTRVEKKVRDHCHLTGKYRGAAHNSCNLQYQVANFIPIFFHNFSKYDCHLFIKDLAHFEGTTSVIAQNKETYISMSHIIPMGNKKILELRFLDSFKFMAASLDTLARNLTDDALHNVKEHFPANFDLMKRKGVFCYDYLSSHSKLSDDKLPPIEEFYNTLNDTPCTVEDYTHAQNVWRTMGCQTLKDYMELYLITDVLLLADIFEKFRTMCIDIHELDPCHYFTVPGLSWEAMLKLVTRTTELHLLLDKEMHNFCMRGIRGGIVQCSKRYVRANNKYMKDYIEDLVLSILLYIDANNLYGLAMSQCLPQKDFEWVIGSPEFLLKFFFDNISKLPADATHGYFLEVDLSYPKEIHDYLNDFPPYFEDKKNYVIHYRNLQQCLDLGLKLEKVHRILTFVQSDYLRPFIDINNSHRAKTNIAFEKDFFKLLNNAIYGKTMENVEKRTDVRIVKVWETVGQRNSAVKLISRPNFNSLIHFGENMVAIQMNKEEILLDKPIQMGFAILEISKHFMYDFYYGFLKKKFGNDVTLAYTDTDSMVLEFIGRDFYEEITPDDIKARFDTSDLPLNNRFNFPIANKKVLGMMKDENSGRIMTEFIGLRPKMYSMKVEDCAEIKKSKGVKKSVLRKYTFETYRECLFNKKNLSDSMLVFRSKKHTVFTNKVNKITLSYNDDKRKIREDGINTYAWGHYAIANENHSISSNEIDLESINPMVFDVSLNDIQNLDLASINDLDDLNLDFVE